MSMQGNIGAECAVIDLQALDNNNKAAGMSERSRLKALLEKMKDIREAAKDGWY